VIPFNLFDHSERMNLETLTKLVEDSANLLNDNYLTDPDAPPPQEVLTPIDLPEAPATDSKSTPESVIDRLAAL
jgi:hypothetical protein